MTISLSDIDRWDPGAISTVFQAAIARAHGNRTASAAIGQVMGFLDWDGDAAVAARSAAQRTMVDLNSHADACEAVGRAAETAAGEVAEVKRRLAEIRQEATKYHLTIDNETGEVHLPKLYGFSSDEQYEIELARDRIKVALKSLMNDATKADRDLAAAIRGADGELSPQQVDVAVNGENPFPTFGECFREDYQEHAFWDVVKGGFKSAFTGGIRGAFAGPEGAVLGFVGGFGKGVLLHGAGIDSAWRCRSWIPMP